jgi:hypothetical protein
MITEEQYEEIVEFLKNEQRKWSRKYDLDGCVRCGTSGTDESHRHSGDGLCKRCISGDSKILVKDMGVVRIDQMVGSGDFYVWSGEDWCKTEAICNGEREVIQVISSNGDTIWVTGDHEILTDDGMVSADQIQGQKINQTTFSHGSERHVEKVYDLINVGNKHRCVANNIVVSNCWDLRRHIRASAKKSFELNKITQLTIETWETLSSKEMQNA